MRMIAALLFFNKDFMQGFVTTIGSKVYIPRKRLFDAEEGFTAWPWKTLAHELVHVHDAQVTFGRSVMYGVLYLLPQILAVFSLLAVLAVVDLWWLMSLGFLLLLAPIPAPIRTVYERRGYAMNIATNFWRYGSVQQHQIDHTIGRFTTSKYYWMWPFKKSMHRWIEDTIVRVQNGEIIANELDIYKAVYDILVKHTVLKVDSNA